MVASTNVYLFAAAGALVTAAAFLLLSQRMSRTRAAVALAGTWAALFALAWAVAATDWNDADGFTDCNPYCTSTHMAVSTAFFFGPLFVVALLVLAWVLRDRAD